MTKDVIRTRKRYVAQRIAYWRTKLLLDPNIIIQIQFCNSSPDGDWDINDATKHEEQLCTKLTQIFLGPKNAEASLQAFLHNPGGVFMDIETCGLAYYQTVVTVYNTLLHIKNPQHFKALANSCACHEMCHVLVSNVVPAGS